MRRNNIVLGALALTAALAWTGAAFAHEGKPYTRSMKHTHSRLAHFTHHRPAEGYYATTTPWLPEPVGTWNPGYVYDSQWCYGPGVCTPPFSGVRY
jgi:hypothetical protein